MEGAKKILVIISFATVVFGLAVWNLLTPDEESSVTERRRLAQAPEVTAETVLNAEFSEVLEKYLLDQFPARDGFRAVKAHTALDVFRLSDNNGHYMSEGVVYRLEYPFNGKQALMAAEKIEGIAGSHPESGRIYYSIIPDKNYYSPLRERYPAMDYGAMVSLMAENIGAAEYIDIFDCLDISCYYATDIHWRQEKLRRVAHRLCSAMNVAGADFTGYETNLAGDFAGILAGQLALSLKGEEMLYLTSAATENALVKSIELEGALPVYALDKFNGMEPYDIFLSGAQAIITIENEDAKTGRTLVIFRDSFGSGLAPLLIESYSKITLVDLRHVSSSILDDYVDFKDADVLFIYSTMLINSGGILR